MSACKHPERHDIANALVGADIPAASPNATWSLVVWCPDCGAYAIVREGRMLHRIRPKEWTLPGAAQRTSLIARAARARARALRDDR